MSHIERKTELKRRRQRRAKIKKLRLKLDRAKNPTEAQAVLGKIKLISPFWHPPGQAPAAPPPSAAPEKKKK